MPGAKDRDDGETNAMLFDGASISQLARMFRMDARDVSAKLRDTPPCGERRGFKVYAIKEAAAALVPPRVSEEQILAYIAGMNFKDLPAALNKEVWNGLRARIRFEQEQGDLWKTETVLAAYNQTMQTQRMFALMLADRVNRAEQLTAEQRAVIERLTDQWLDDSRQEFRKIMAEMAPMRPGIMDYADEGENDDARDEAHEADEVREAEQEDYEL